MVEPSSLIVTSYQWNTTGCYTNNKFTGSNPQCFPHGQTEPNVQSVTGDDLNAEDAGTITCTVTISGSNYTSESFTLRISGEQLVYCVITCNATLSHLRVHYNYNALCGGLHGICSTACSFDLTVGVKMLHTYNSCNTDT